jgi:hypothetical protein
MRRVRILRRGGRLLGRNLGFLLRFGRFLGGPGRLGDVLRGRRSAFLSLRNDLADHRRPRRKEQRVPRVDPVRVQDVAVLVPDLRPEIGISEHQVSQVPQRVARDNDVQSGLGRERLRIGRIVRRPVIADLLQVLRRSRRSRLQRHPAATAASLLPFIRPTGRIPLPVHSLPPALDRRCRGRIALRLLRGRTGRPDQPGCQNESPRRHQKRHALFVHAPVS